MEGKLPIPIPLDVKDLDPAPTEVLLNLFDFGGEVLTRTVIASTLRRRALLMNGFFSFLTRRGPATNMVFSRRHYIRFAHDLREGAASYWSRVERVRQRRHNSLTTRTRCESYGRSDRLTFRLLSAYRNWICC